MLSGSSEAASTPKSTLQGEDESSSRALRWVSPWPGDGTGDRDRDWDGDGDRDRVTELKYVVR